MAAEMTREPILATQRTRRLFKPVKAAKWWRCAKNATGRCPLLQHCFSVRHRRPRVIRRETGLPKQNLTEQEPTASEQMELHCRTSESVEIDDEAAQQEARASYEKLGDVAAGIWKLRSRVSCCVT
jgi:hypothetical protein